MYASIGIAIQILHWRRRVRAVGGLIGAASARRRGTMNHANGMETVAPARARCPRDGFGTGFDGRFTSDVCFGLGAAALLLLFLLFGRGSELLADQARREPTEL